MAKKKKFALAELEKELLLLRSRCKHQFIMAYVFILISGLIVVLGAVQIFFTESLLFSIILLKSCTLTFAIGSYCMSLAYKTESEIRKFLYTKVALTIWQN
jgi:hypothetical protein